MFLIEWVFDKLGYMPKVSTSWDFPTAKNLYTPHEFKKPAVKKVAKKVAKKAPKKKV